MHAGRGRALPEPRGLDANYVSRWERGTVPHPYHAYLLCLAFQSSPAKLGLPASELGLATEVTAYGTLAPEQNATNRREFGKAFIGSVAAGVGFTDLELLTDISGIAPPVWPLSALAGNGKLLELEVGSVEHVAAVTFHLEQLRRQAPGDYLLRLVASHINFMRSHLPSTPAKSRRLLSAVAEAAAGAPVSLGTIFRTFLTAGAISFGGGVVAYLREYTVSEAVPSGVGPHGAHDRRPHPGREQPAGDVRRNAAHMGSRVGQHDVVSRRREPFDATAEDRHQVADDQRAH